MARRPCQADTPADTKSVSRQTDTTADTNAVVSAMQSLMRSLRPSCVLRHLRESCRRSFLDLSSEKGPGADLLRLALKASLSAVQQFVGGAAPDNRKPGSDSVAPGAKPHMPDWCQILSILARPRARHLRSNLVAPGLARQEIRGLALRVSRGWLSAVALHSQTRLRAALKCDGFVKRWRGVSPRQTRHFIR